MEKYKEDKIGLEDDPEETAVILAALESFKYSLSLVSIADN